MVHVIALAGGKQAGDVGHVAIVRPQAAHRIMHRREDFHRHFARIFADEVLVDFDDRTQFAVDLFRIEMRQVQIDQVLTVQAETHFGTNLENRPGCDVARHQVAVGRVPFLEEIPGLAVFIGPDASTFAAGRLGHQAAFVFARQCSRVYLDELAITENRSLLIGDRSGRAGRDGTVGAATEHHAETAGRQDHRIGGEGFHPHIVHVLGHDAATLAVIVENQADKFPLFKFLDQFLLFVAPHLLIQYVQQLLTGTGAGERGPGMFGAAEGTQVEQSFRRTGEHHAHPVQQVNQAGRCIAHRLDRRLIGQEVAAQHRILEMLPGRVVLPLGVESAVDAALGAGRM